MSHKVLQWFFKITVMQRVEEAAKFGYNSVTNNTPNAEIESKFAAFSTLVMVASNLGNNLALFSIRGRESSLHCVFSTCH